MQIMQPTKRSKTIKFNKDLKSIPSTLPKVSKPMASRKPISALMMNPGRKQNTITINADLIVVEGIKSYKKDKFNHVDPRYVPKKNGYGKGNWGDLQDEINLGTNYVY